MLMRRNKNVMPLLGIIRNVSTQDLTSCVLCLAQLTDVWIKTRCHCNVQIYLK